MYRQCPTMANVRATVNLLIPCQIDSSHMAQYMVVN